MVYIMCPKSLVSWSVNREGDLTEGTKILAPSITRESQSPFSHHVHGAEVVLLHCTISVLATRYGMQRVRFNLILILIVALIIQGVYSIQLSTTDPL
jgi:hypothetical protein